jgi:hypothetical protein
MLCGWMISSMQHINATSVALYFPLNLLLIEKYFNLKKESTTKVYLSKLVGWGSAFTIAIFFQLSIGHVETAYHNILFAAIYFLVRLTLNKNFKEQIFSKIAVLSIAGITAILLYAPQLLATIELTKLSPRESAISEEASTGVIWPLHSLKLFVLPKSYPIYLDIFPEDNGRLIDYGMVYGYIGIIPLILILVSAKIMFQKKVDQNSELKIYFVTFSICILTTVLYAIGGNTQFFSLIRNTVPGLNFFRIPVKSLYIIEFYLAVFSALGLQVILNILKNNTNKVPFNKLLYPALPIIIILISYLDLRINNQWITPTLPASFWLETPPALEYIHNLDKDCRCDNPQENTFQNWRVRASQVEIKGSHDILNWDIQKDLLNTPHVNMNVVNNIMSNESYSALHIERTKRINNVPNSIDLNKGTISLSESRYKVNQLQSVKYIISDIPYNDSKVNLLQEFKYKQPYKHLLHVKENNKDYVETDRAYLYEFTDTVPRIQLISKSNALYMSASDSKASNIFEAVLDKNFDLKSQVIIENQKGATENPLIKPGFIDTNDLDDSYKIADYTQQKITIKTETSQENYLVIADNYYPGWQATVDGVSVPIEKANYNFRAILVPSGSHTIEMFYVPTYFRLGSILFLTGLGILSTSILIIVFSAYLQRKRV